MANIGAEPIGKLDGVQTLAAQSGINDLELWNGLFVKKGTPQEVIDKLAAKVPEMFAHKRVAKRMKAGGSPVKIMSRDEVIAMWAKREESLKELLAGL